MNVVLGTFGPSLYESAGRSFNYYFYLIIFLRCGARDLRPLALSSYLVKYGHVRSSESGTDGKTDTDTEDGEVHGG